MASVLAGTIGNSMVPCNVISGFKYVLAGFVGIFIYTPAVHLLLVPCLRFPAATSHNPGPVTQMMLINPQTPLNSWKWFIEVL